MKGTILYKGTLAYKLIKCSNEAQKISELPNISQPTSEREREREREREEGAVREK